MVDLGYSTHNSLLNLGSLAIFTALWFVKLILLFLFWVFSKITGKGRRQMVSMAKSMLFGELISILIDASFEFLISSYLQF
jgi:hypothetical protein